MLMSFVLYNSENMKGWIEHFSNKYIVCGRLVQNDATI
jgi:membrane-associated progesterone receptor component